MVEHIQGAGYVDFQRGRQRLRFLFLLLSQGVVQILQNGYVLRLRVAQVGLVDDMHRTVDDGLFDGLQSVAPADDQLAQRQNEIGLERQRIVIVAVVEVDVHRIDVAVAGGRNADHLSAERVDQREILALGIADDDVIVSQQNDVADLALCRERFAGAWRAQNQAVRILQLLAIHHDQVVGQGIQAAIQRLAAALEQLLRGEGYENRGRRGRQPALNSDFVEAQRQAGYHAVFLLEVQRNQLAVVLLGKALRLLDVEDKLLLIVRRIHHQEGDEEHALVAALQIFQQLLRFAAVGGQIGRNDVHVISGTDGLLLLLDLHLIEVGDLAFDIPDGCYLVDGLNVQGHDEAGFHGKEIRQAAVIEVRSQDGEKADCRLLLSHAKAALFAEIKAGRRNEVLGRQAGGRQPLPVKNEGCLSIHMEHIVHELQPLMPVKRGCRDAQPLEVVQQINLDALQTRLCRLDVLCLDAKGNELGLGQAVVALGLLVLQHFCIFVPDFVVAVIPVGNQDALLKGFRAGRQIEKRKLQVNTAVKIVEEITPALEDRRLVVVLRELIIDVLKLDGFGVVAIRNAADAVRPHALIRNGVLRGIRSLLALLLIPGHERLELLLFCARQLDLFSGVICHEGFSSPPALCGRFGRWLHRSFRSGTPVCGDGQSAPECSAAGAPQAAAHAAHK